MCCRIFINIPLFISFEIECFFSFLGVIQTFFLAIVLIFMILLLLLLLSVSHVLYLPKQCLLIITWDSFPLYSNARWLPSAYCFLAYLMPIFGRLSPVTLMVDTLYLAVVFYTSVETQVNFKINVSEWEKRHILVIPWIYLTKMFQFIWPSCNLGPLSLYCIVINYLVRIVSG